MDIIKILQGFYNIKVTNILTTIVKQMPIPEEVLKYILYG